jgi:hypothetical protein
LPTVIWFGGLLAWGIVFLEAMVAAPLWMIAHLDAHGDGMGQRTAHGYIFLLNVLFRPVLMVFGLIAGWLMMNLFGSVLRQIMSLLYSGQGVGFGGAQSIIMFVVILIIFAVLAMMTVNRSFSLIHHLPNETLSWVGGHLRGVGGGETESAEQKIIVAGGVVATGMGKQLEGMGRGGGRRPRDGGGDGGGGDGGGGGGAGWSGGGGGGGMDPHAADRWYNQSGGVDGLSPEHQARAQEAHSRWQESTGHEHGFEDYVGYVQGQQAQKRAIEQ